MKKLKNGEGMSNVRQGGNPPAGMAGRGMSGMSDMAGRMSGMGGTMRGMGGKMGGMEMGRGGANMTGTDSAKSPKGTSGGGIEMDDNGVDVIYSAFLINGKSSEIAEPLRVKKGDRVRLRLLNPSGATSYRVALDGHRLTVTHADGNPVQPVEVDFLEVGMGERYDVFFTANNPGVWALMAASPEDARGRVRTLVRYDDVTGTPPPLDFMPSALKSGKSLAYADLIAEESGEFLAAKPDRVIELVLNGSMMPYRWTINNQAFPNADALEIVKGERVLLRMVNKSMMRHPMHLHGHFFRLLNTAGGTRAAPMKDTLIVNSMETLEVEFLADNPGKWAFHCHHAYHMDAGMFRVFTYRA